MGLEERHGEPEGSGVVDPAVPVAGVVKVDLLLSSQAGT